MPYGRYERELVGDLLADQARRPLAFSIHVGDVKSGSSPCDDAVYEDRQHLLAHSSHPLVLLAGDNDWLDCARPAAGGHDPFERLDRLRKRLIERLPAIEGVRRSATTPEQALWMHGGVLFLTLNVPGSPLADSGPGAGLKRSALEWLDAGLDAARSGDIRALVVAFHANPGFAAHAAGKPSRRYGVLLDRIARFAARDGRPLLIIHGDTHIFRNDQPLHDPDSGRRLDNVMRLETHGSPWLGWTEVTVDVAADPAFRITPHGIGRD